MNHSTLSLKGLALACTIFVAQAAQAGPQAQAVERVVTGHAIPAVTLFSEQTKALDLAAQNDCTSTALIPAYHAAFDAWMGLQHLNIGPIEADARSLTIAFWPDKKGMIPKTLKAQIEAQDPAVFDAGEFAHVSIASRGLFALEFMLFDDEFTAYDQDDYSCHLVQAIAHDLSQTAAYIASEWTREDGYGAALLNAGTTDSARYQSESEALQTLYTMLITGLENTAVQRIGRPLGSFEKPRPKRAEAYRSGRALRNIILSVQAARDLAVTMAPDTPTDTLQILDEVLAKAQALDDPTLASVADPFGRLKVEIVAQRIEASLGAIANDIGAPLGVSAGFNASDGD
jgi:predicted lipoprotein